MNITAAFNIYNDALALPGLLENVTAYFDDVLCIHAGPGGKISNDGTMEILARWGIRTVIDRIDDGFGVVRAKLIDNAKTEWVWIFDTDERFHPRAPILRCEGDQGYPQYANPELKVIKEDGMFDQGSLLRTLMGHDVLAIRTCRRHWFDYTWKRPCQNWQSIPDWQLRIVRKHPDVTFLSDHRMHEKLRNLKTQSEPRYASEQQGDPRGLHVDHYHCFWKAQEPEQRKEDLDIYEALHKGSTEEMWSRKGYV